MTDQRRSRIIKAVIIASVVLLMLILLDLLLWNHLRTKLRQERPLVMIHSPSPNGGFAQGDIVTVHAIARASGEAELSRIDLWIDGVMLAERATTDPASMILVLHQSWIPQSSGEHEIIVTAQTSDGIQGQASLNIEVFSTEADEVAAGEEEPPVADSSDSSQAEDEPESHAFTSPGGSGGGDGGVADRPAENPAPPGSPRDIYTRIGFSSMQALPSSEEPTMLRLEILELTTTRAFEGLHCYIGLGGALPRWYPDGDGDQSTDESFASLGAGIWEVAPYFSDDRALNLPWGSIDALTVEATCVGLTSGGMEAVEAGYLTLSIPVESWDGIARMAWSDTLEGRFRLTYRVTPLYGEPPGHRIGLDLGMPPPTNLRIGFYTLHWRYPEDEPIDGFRIFLNGELQWTEPPDARQSYLPYEWLTPPCDQDYQFYVDAYQGEDWSPPSNTVVVTNKDTPGSDACERTLIIEFQELETFDLSNDEDHEDWIGPVYGSFYVNDQEIGFNSSCHWGRYCDYMGFGDYSTYDIRSLTSHWGPGPARFTVNVGLEEDIVVGFDIQDQDSASWNADDTVCADSRTVRADALGRTSTTSVGGDFDRGCRVTLTISPTLDSPATSRSGQPPRPQLAVTDLSVDETTGQLEIHIINGGYATWPGKDLDVIARWPSGSLIGQYTFPELVLRPGETTILKHPDLVPSLHPPLGACILLDPGNLVLEEEDYTPDVWRRGEYCRPLPDLTITDVELDEIGERLLVTVHNAEDGTVDNRTIDLLIELPDGRTIVPERAWEQVSMEAYRSSLFIWEGLTESVRQVLLDGFTIVVDPYNHIAESSGTNNSYVVPAGGNFILYWYGAEVPRYEVQNPLGDVYNSFRLTFNINAYAVTDSGTRELVSWEATRTEIEFNHEPFGRETRFELEGDEDILLTATGEIHITQLCVGEYCQSDLDYVAMTIPPEEWSAASDCWGESPSRLPIPVYLGPRNLLWHTDEGYISLPLTLCRPNE
jgi:hypothetical protein